MSAFREVLEECELNDLGFSGQWFTWKRGRLFSNNIKERLDKVVAIQSGGIFFQDIGVVYTVVINGRHGEEFQPHRGLRQGDPLSSYLFLICAKGFSCLLALTKAEGRISATKLGRVEETISHLFRDSPSRSRVISYWAIWYNRNKIYHERVYEQAPEVVGFVKAYCIEINTLGVLLRQVQVVDSSEWKPPENGTIKVNFNASFNYHTRKSCLGVIARNNEGLVMAACTFPWENISDPVMAEARACLQAITMAKEISFQDICIEGDALTVIWKLNSLGEDKFEISSLIREIKESTPKFRRVSFRHIPRVAMEGRRHENPQYWIEEVLRAVEGLVDGERRGNRECEEMES
ncbi:hypothetical protein PVK06_011669 [Gossypium arboreum]|uniref:RNase H type-1 domain-containing protein n=1 Tax=Gossypium arboreum TaxID=29729 RepID=A0ABR0Q9D8_GOSAR|nr:hypothetical protein PVK06_011669 [Gossypium arboreum]